MKHRFQQFLDNMNLTQGAWVKYSKVNPSVPARRLATNNWTPSVEFGCLMMMVEQLIKRPSSSNLVKELEIHISELSEKELSQMLLLISDDLSRRISSES